MIIATCIRQLKSSDGSVYGYLLCRNDGQKYTINKAKLIEGISTNNIFVTNARICGYDIIVGVGVEKESGHKEDDYAILPTESVRRIVNNIANKEGVVLKTNKDLGLFCAKVNMADTTAKVEKLSNDIILIHSDVDIFVTTKNKFSANSLENVFYGQYTDSSVLELNIKNFDTSRVTTMHKLFEDVRASVFDASNLNTERVLDISKMFRYSKFEKIDISKLNLSNVIDMSSLFEGCVCSEIILGCIDTSKVLNMAFMFSMLDTDTIDVSNIRTYNVITMEGMFSQCKCSKIIGVENFNTSSVKNFANMFSYVNIDKLNLSGYDMSEAVNISRMFYGANIRELNISNWQLDKVQNMNEIFKYSNIERLIISKEQNIIPELLRKCNFAGVIELID